MEGERRAGTIAVRHFDVDDRAALGGRPRQETLGALLGAQCHRRIGTHCAQCGNQRCNNSNRRHDDNRRDVNGGIERRDAKQKRSQQTCAERGAAARALRPSTQGACRRPAPSGRCRTPWRPAQCAHPAHGFARTRCSSSRCTRRHTPEAARRCRAPRRASPRAATDERAIHAVADQLDRPRCPVGTNCLIVATIAAARAGVVRMITACAESEPGASNRLRSFRWVRGR